MTELRRILDEMTDIDLRLATPGVLVSGQRDELLRRRRTLEARFDVLQQRPDYLSQVDAYADTLATGHRAFPA